MACPGMSGDWQTGKGDRKRGGRKGSIVRRSREGK